jgi:hypothetical protein
MTKQDRVPVKEWRNMNQAKEIAKEWRAFDEAKSALVKAIRSNHGEDAPISFQRYSFGIPETATSNDKAATTSATISPEMLAAFMEMMKKNGMKVVKAK